MADFRLTDQTMHVLKKSLNLRAQKQQVIAGNIANAETPGYAARKMSFEADLRKAINTPELQGRKLQAKHFPIGSIGISGVQGKIVKQVDTDPLGDGNSVSLDDEMFDLAENQLLFEADAQMLKKKLTILRFAAGDGR
jgi:flagellar basal-body rod protein FlgB